LASIGDWLYEAAPMIAAIGGLVAGVAAVVAAILLWRTLRETRKQTQLGYKGVLGIAPGGEIEWSAESKEKSDSLTRIGMRYRFVQNNNALLLLRVREWLFVNREKIDVMKWYEYLRPKLKDKILTPVIPDLNYNVTKKPLQGTRKFYSQWARGNRKAKDKFFAHAIFAYEDLTRDIFWIYIRWNLSSNVTQSRGREDLEIVTSVVQ
jgi:hypothetical protein